MYMYRCASVIRTPLGGGLQRGVWIIKNVWILEIPPSIAKSLSKQLLRTVHTDNQTVVMEAMVSCQFHVAQCTCNVNRALQCINVCHCWWYI